MSEGADRSGERARVGRAKAAADALGSARAEGLDPDRAEPVLAAWARGELTDEHLEEIRQLMLRNRELTASELIAQVRRGDAPGATDASAKPS